VHREAPAPRHLAEGSATAAADLFLAALIAETQAVRDSSHSCRVTLPVGRVGEYRVGNRVVDGLCRMAGGAFDRPRS
jgi:hypothetical protein